MVLCSYFVFILSLTVTEDFIFFNHLIWKEVLLNFIIIELGFLIFSINFNLIHFYSKAHANFHVNLPKTFIFFDVLSKINPLQFITRFIFFSIDSLNFWLFVTNY